MAKRKKFKRKKSQGRRKKSEKKLGEEVKNLQKRKKSFQKNHLRKPKILMEILYLKFLKVGQNKLM